MTWAGLRRRRVFMQLVKRPRCCTTGSRPLVRERLSSFMQGMLGCGGACSKACVLALLQALGSLQEDSSILHHAAAFGQAQVLEILVAAGVIVDARDKAQNTALHIAAGEPAPGACSSARHARAMPACLLLPVDESAVAQVALQLSVLIHAAFGQRSS